MSGHGLFGGRKSLFGAEGSDELNVDLNLTPLMDVMSNILFFLLASFGAAIISFLAASVPVQSEAEDEDEPPRTDKVTVSVRITETSYRITASGLGIDPAKLGALKQEVPKKGNEYDLKGLTQALLGIKREFPASDTVMLIPSEKTVYEQIIQTMEAAKDTRISEGKRLSLFPKVVVADLVKEDPAPAAEPPPGEPGAP